MGGLDLLLTDANAATAPERQDVPLVVKGLLRAIKPAFGQEDVWISENGRIDGGFAECHADGRL